MLAPLTAFTLVLLGLAGTRLLRRRLPQDLPLGVGLLALMSLGVTAIVDPEAGDLWSAVFLGLAFTLSQIPAALDRVTQLARVRGATRWAKGLSTVVWALQPGARNLLMARLQRAVHRGVQGPDAARAALEALDASQPLLGRVPDAALQLAWREGQAGLLLASEGTAGLAGRFNRERLGWLAHPPNGAGVLMIRALVAEGRRDLATGVLLAMEASAERSRLTPADSEVALQRARLELVAAAADRVAVAEALSGASSLRPWVGAADRARLEALASTGVDFPVDWADRDASDDGPVAVESPTGSRDDGTGEGTAAAPRTGVAPAASAGRTAATQVAHALAAHAATALRTGAALPSMASALLRPAPVTAAIVAVLLGVQVLLVALGLDADGVGLLRAGACAQVPVADGEAWRLFSSTLLHAGWLHLGFNSLFLLIFGTLSERLLGPTRHLAIYLVSGVLGALAHVAFGGPEIVVGASGAIFGILGASLAGIRAARATLPTSWYRRQMASLTSLLILNLAIGLLVEMISFASHAGGFFAGYGMAFLLWPSGAATVRPRAGRGLKVAVAVGLLAAVGTTAVGLWHTAPLTDSELVPWEIETVAAGDPEATGRGQVAVGRPIVWRRHVAPDGEPLRPVLVGESGGLYEVEVRCLDTVSAADQGLIGADAEVVAQAANRDQPASWPQFVSGPEGFAVRTEGPRQGRIGLTAWRVEAHGAVVLRFFADAEEAPALERLLPGVLARTRLLSCD